MNPDTPNKSIRLTVVGLAATYTKKVEHQGATVPQHIVATRGETFEVDGEQAERLLATGSVVVEGEAAPAPVLDADTTSALASVEGVTALSDEETGEANPAPTDLLSVSGLATKIEEEKLNAKQTIALAGGDPGTAKVVLEAEKSLGDPRAGVVKGLTKLIDPQ